MGDAESARRSIERLERRPGSGGVTAFLAGFVHFGLGEVDAFVASLDRAFQLHNLPLLELMYSPLFETVRTDPRVLDLLRRQLELRHPAG